MFKERRKLPKGSLVYISGPITGRSEQEWRLHFGLVADALKSKGLVPVSPVDIGDELVAHHLSEHDFAEGAGIDVWFEEELKEIRW